VGPAFGRDIGAGKARGDPGLFFCRDSPQILCMGLLDWIRGLAGMPVEIPDDAWQGALAQVPWARALDGASAARLREFTGRFLGDKTITPTGELQLDDDQRLLVAMLCCRPVLHLDYGWLGGWQEVIVYPAPFRTSLRRRDEGTGVISERDAHASGQSFWRGPLVLNWSDILANLHKPQAGFDLVVHEIAHKLDGLHDGVDGAPRLHMDERMGWARDFQAAYDALLEDLDAGRKPPINPYAASSHAEFFAVCSEYWFTAPELLRSAYPAVARRLDAYYGPG